MIRVRKKKKDKCSVMNSTFHFHDIENLPWWQTLMWLGKSDFSSSSHKASKPSQKDSLRDLHIYMLFLTLTERQPERSPHLLVVLDPHRKTAWEISTFTCVFFVYPPQPPLHILHEALFYLKVKPTYTFVCVQKLPVHSTTRSKYHQWQWPRL